jgi:adenylate kinase
LVPTGGIRHTCAGREALVRKYIIIGPQGSGKGTQARMLAKDFDLVHISVGDIFRWHVQNRTKLGTKVQRYMKEGRLVPDEMVADVVKTRLDIHDWRHGFVLDGFPRNGAQAEFFLENYDIDAVIAIELPEEAAIARMQSRRLCSSCGLDYNLIQLRPQVAEVCDNCGGRLVPGPTTRPRRSAPARDYREKTQLIRTSAREGAIVTVDGTPGPDVVQADARKLGLCRCRSRSRWPDPAGLNREGLEKAVPWLGNGLPSCPRAPARTFRWYWRVSWREDASCGESRWSPALPGGALPHLELSLSESVSAEAAELFLRGNALCIRDSAARTAPVNERVTEAYLREGHPPLRSGRAPGGAAGDRRARRPWGRAPRSRST